MKSKQPEIKVDMHGNPRRKSASRLSAVTRSKPPENKVVAVAMIAFVNNGNSYQVCLDGSQGNLLIEIITKLHGGKLKILDKPLNWLRIKPSEQWPR